MKPESRRLLLLITGALVISLVSTGHANGQAGTKRIAEVSAGDKPLMAEQVFKNVQLLKGISVKEFMETMGFFAAATNKTCTTCHGDASGGSWERYADDPPQKQTARKMMLMVDAINKSYFGGKREVTSYSCHRNAERPRVTPLLAEQYGTPSPEEADEIPQQAPGAPTPDQVFDRYIQALGGAEKLAAFTGFIAKGTYQGYDEPEGPVEIYAKAPGQFFQVVHGASGESTWVDDGRSAWVAQSDPDATPVPLMALRAGDSDGSHLESELYFPGRIKQLLTKLRVGFPITGVTSILADSVGVGVDDRELTVVQGATAAGNNVKCTSTQSRDCLCGWCAIPTCRSVSFLRRLTMPIIAMFPESWCPFG